MLKNKVIVSVFILFPALQGGVMIGVYGQTLAIKILPLTFTVICLILFTIRGPLHTIDPAGTKSTMIPATSTVLLAISLPKKRRIAPK